MKKQKDLAQTKAALEAEFQRVIGKMQFLEEMMKYAHDYKEESEKEDSK